MIVLILVLLLNVPQVQNLAKDIGVKYLNKKLGTTVQLEKLAINFPNAIVIDSLYLEDQSGDTLMYSGHLFMKMDMWGLLSGDVQVDSVRLNNFYANVDRTLPDTTFNFNYITDAFASGGEEEPEDTSSPMNIDIGSIRLHNIQLHYLDDVTGYDGKIVIGDFKTHFDSLNLDKIDVELDSILLSNTQVRFIRSSPLKVDNETVETEDTTSDSDSGLPQLSINGLLLKNIRLRYIDKVDHMDGRVQLDSFLVVPNKLDLNRQDIDLRKVVMNRSLLSFSMKLDTAASENETESENDNDEEMSASTSEGWTLSLDTLELLHNQLKYDAIGTPKQQEGMDFNHLDVTDFQLLASNIFYSDTLSHLFLQNLAFDEQSGFALKKFTTQVNYTNQGARLDHLLLITGNSRISKKLAVSYPSLSALSDSPGELGLDLNIDSAVIGMKDVYFFQPDMKDNEYLAGLSGAPIYLKGIVQGKLKDLNIDTLRLHVANQTSLALKARLKNILHPDKGVFDIKLDKLATGQKDLNTLLPEDILPSSIAVPDQLSLSGKFDGGLSDFVTQLHLKSSDGDANMNAEVHNLTDSIRATYALRMKANQLRLDRIMKNDTLYGPVTLDLAVAGRGITLDSVKAQLRAQIVQAKYNGYNYENLALDGKVNHGIAHIKAGMEDPNLHFNLLANADLQDSIPSADFNFDLKNADLEALHFVDSQLQLAGQIKGDFAQIDMDQPEGHLLLNHWEIKKNGQKIQIDSVLLAATSVNNNHRIKFRSPFATFDINGDYKLSEVAPLIPQLEAKYMGTADSLNMASKDTLSSWEMHMDLQLLPTPLWEKILPEMSRFKGGHLTAMLSSNPDSVELQTTILPLTYNDISVDSTVIRLYPDQKGLKYALAVHEVIDSGLITIPHLFLNGNLYRDNISMNLFTEDEEWKNRFHIAGNLKMKDSSYHFSLAEDSLVLNYKSWVVPADNYISYNPERLLIHHLELKNGNQYIKAQTDSTLKGNPLTVAFQHFDISNLTEMVLSDSMALGGFINGSAEVDNLLTNMHFVTDLSLDSLSFNHANIGSLGLQVNNDRPDTYAVNMQLKGDSNDVKINGEYVTTDNGSFDFNVDLNSLSMSTIESLSFGQIADAEGEIIGDLSIKGTADAPLINGKLGFQKVGFNVTQLNERLKLANENILFDPGGIHFNQFTILNGNEDKAVIDGSVLTKKYTHFNFDLGLTADNFRVLNLPKKEGSAYYGKVYLSTKTKITGDESLPKINMAISLNKGTDFTYVMMDENPQEVSSEGIVKFIDPEVAFDSTHVAKVDSIRYNKDIQGIDLSADIVIDTSARFNIVMDPVTGDNLYVRGRADLNFTLSPGGKMSLTGRYNLIDGLYNLSFESLIKKQFKLLRGSYILWKGDPLKAEMDITAEYDVDASPMELVENQLSSDNESLANRYKQKLPFQVFLNVKGDLMKPDISFQLGMPEDARDALDGAVYTRINQINTKPSEVNKQTLGLLVFNHFIGENPLKTSGGGGAEEKVRKSASKILSKQLNKLAGNLVNGVDIDLALESSKDYSSGQAENQTNLNVGLSKSLFNDRTTVYVGGGIPLEGNNGNNASQIVGDVAVEYLLSKDGRYRLKAYRKNKYQGVIEGEFVETGVSFIIVMSYNKFKELFKSADELNKEENK